MDLIKKYGPEELARMTYRMLQEKRNKKTRTINQYEADRTASICRRARRMIRER